MVMDVLLSSYRSDIEYDHLSEGVSVHDAGDVAAALVMPDEVILESGVEIHNSSDVGAPFHSPLVDREEPALCEVGSVLVLLLSWQVMAIAPESHA